MTLAGFMICKVAQEEHHSGWMTRHGNGLRLGMYIGKEPEMLGRFAFFIGRGLDIFFMCRSFPLEAKLRFWYASTVNVGIRCIII